MPRRRLYHTHEEQRLANNAKAKRWRDRNTEFIKQQRQDKKRAEEKTRAQELQIKKAKWFERNKRQSVRAQAVHSQMEFNCIGEQDVDKDLARPLLAEARNLYADFRCEVPNSIDYLEDLYQLLITPVHGGGYRHHSYLAEPAKKLEDIDDALSKLHMTILKRVGPLTEWKRVKSMREDIRQVVKWIENLHQVAKDGTLALEEAYDKKELQFRQQNQR